MIDFGIDESTTCVTSWSFCTRPEIGYYLFRTRMIKTSMEAAP